MNGTYIKGGDNMTRLELLTVLLSICANNQSKHTEHTQRGGLNQCQEDR